MGQLTSENLTVLFLSVGVILATARIGAELVQRFGQPSVLGEILAGILLGPTCLGVIAPEWFRFLFPREGVTPAVLEGFNTIGLAMFLLVAGLEVDLSTIWRQGRAAMSVGVAGIALPFGFGLAAGIVAPRQFGMAPDSDPFTFTFFLATALSISALPVIAKTLMDLNLYRTDLGMVVIAASVFNDLIGWIVFAIVLGMMKTNSAASALSISTTIVLTLAFATVLLTAGRWAIHRSLPFIQAHTSWPGGVMGFALALTLLGAAFTQWVGVHAIFGAFLVGVAVGDSPHLRERTRMTMHHFISFIFAPLFFGSIGLSVDFGKNFDPLLCTLVLALACVGKVFGCAIGARLGGMARAEAWATGFAMNARGAMEIILGLLALQRGVIDERMFVALVVMAIGTSMLSGPMMRLVLRLERPVRLASLLNARTFVRQLAATDRMDAIRELCASLTAVGLDRDTVEQAVLERESVMPTGIGNRVAVPHARVEGLASPLAAVGLSEQGIDFDAPDGDRAQIIFVILTPRHDDGAQVKVLADIARTFAHPKVLDDLLNVQSFTEFLATLKTHRHAEGE